MSLSLQIKRIWGELSEKWWKCSSLVIPIPIIESLTNLFGGKSSYLVNAAVTSLCWVGIVVPSFCTMWRPGPGGSEHSHQTRKTQKVECCLEYFMVPRYKIYMDINGCSLNKSCKNTERTSVSHRSERGIIYEG